VCCVWQVVKTPTMISNNPVYFTRAPFVTLLSGRAQSGRWSSYEETGVVHWITFSLSDFIFTYFLFIHFILDIINGLLYPVKQLDHFLGKLRSHFSELLHTTLVRDWIRTALLASVISSQPFRRLNLSYLTPTVLNVRWQIKPKTYGYEPSVTDAN